MIEYSGIFFDWDDTKEVMNKRKHGISFNEAMTVFADEHAQIYSDEEHSDDEERFVLIGCSENEQLLMVCHCYRESETVTRLISARKATRDERKKYENGG